MEAAIIIIGDEILIGQVIDTNSAFICTELNHIGIKASRIIAVSDNKNDILNAINALKQDVDIVIITGGLGPTNDDITKKALAEHFNQKLVLNNEALEHIRKFFERRHVSISQRNRDQALLPERCRLVPNEFGTAMGMWFEQDNNKHIISLPGVPYEMKAMITGHVIPELTKRFELPSIIHRTILTTGIAESVMADRISAWESELPRNIKLAYLPSPGILRLRLTAAGNDKKALEEQLVSLMGKLRRIIGTSIFGYDDTTIEAKTGVMLRQLRATVGVAESCTGGNIGRMITSVPGSSGYFMGGIIAYDNNVKTEILGVDKKVIEKYGSVSKQVVLQMADGVRRLLDTGYAIAVSGIAGPAGGTAENPVGTVWIAVSGKDAADARLFKFGSLRETNIIRASVAALNMLRLRLIRDSKQIT